MTKKILVVKTSSLGDVVQSLAVLDELKNHFSSIAIDWVIEEKYQDLLLAHPLIDSVITFNRHRIMEFIRRLRRKKYDVLIDLQGNTKSALITLFAKAKKKVGFGRKSVTEFPNLLVTTKKYNIPKSLSIQNFYLEIVRKHFNIKKPSNRCPFNLIINPGDIPKSLDITNKDCLRVMVAMNSARKSKELENTTLISFLQKFSSLYRVHFYLTYGNNHEKEKCNYLKSQINVNSTILDKMSIPVWQNVMGLMDLIFTVDTSALYLAGTTGTSTFSVFGPTDSKIFKPKGKHFSTQGICPYGIKYLKQCPHLRNCQTSACIKSISLERLWSDFQSCLIEIKAYNFKKY